MLTSNFGAGGIVSAQTPANAPEPATAGLLALGGFAALTRGKKR